MPLPDTDKIQEALEAQRAADDKVESLTPSQRQVFELVMGYVKPSKADSEPDTPEAAG